MTNVAENCSKVVKQKMKSYSFDKSAVDQFSIYTLNFRSNFARTLSQSSTCPQYSPILIPTLYIAEVKKEGRRVLYGDRENRKLSLDLKIY